MNLTAAQTTAAEDGGLDVADERYLIFRIGRERFATPLLAVREIVEPLAYRCVPNPAAHFLGLANLRGQVIGILDFGRLFGLPHKATKTSGALLIFECEGAAMAGLVEQVEAVTTIPPGAITNECPTDSSVPREALAGIAKTEFGLLQVLTLAALVGCGTSAAAAS